MLYILLFLHNLSKIKRCLIADILTLIRVAAQHIILHFIIFLIINKIVKIVSHGLLNVSI